MVRRTACAALLLLGLTGRLAAEEQPDSSRSYEMDPVVVTATNTGTARSLLPNALSVVSARHLDRTGKPRSFRC